MPASSVRVPGGSWAAWPSAAAPSGPSAPRLTGPRRPFTPHRGRWGGHVGQIDLIDRRTRDLMTDVAFDIRQRDRVFLATEADSIAFGARARRSSDAMHIVFGIV